MKDRIPLRSPEDAPPAAIPPAVVATPAPPASPPPTAAPVVAAPTGPSADALKAQAELLKLQNQIATQKQAKDAEAAANLEAAKALEAKLAADTRAQLETLRGQVRNQKVLAALPRGVREGFLGQFAEGLEYTEANELTPESVATLTERAKGLEFLLVDPGTPATPDRTNRTTPTGLGAPTPAGAWSEKDMSQFVGAGIKGDPGKCLESDLANTLRANGLMTSWDQAAGGRK